jgi:hypothetical protein
MRHHRVGFVGIVLTAVLSFSVVSCGSGDDSDNDNEGLQCVTGEPKSLGCCLQITQSGLICCDTGPDAPLAVGNTECGPRRTCLLGCEDTAKALYFTNTVNRCETATNPGKYLRTVCSDDRCTFSCSDTL